MRRNIRLVLAYDGTDFHGWQKQPGMRTVQEEVSRVIQIVVRHPVTLNGSGRTDAGVHAAGQVANFETTSHVPAENLRRAVGCRLPIDLTLRQVSEAPLGFRSTRDAVSKLYRYRIHNHPDRPMYPQRQRYTYHFWTPLDVERMQQGADRLVGQHDFAAFATKGTPKTTTVRTVLRFDVYRRGREVRIDVEGTGFLYNQVRNMVGTLVEIGRGHWQPDHADEILASKDRSQAGPTLPARGLCLQWVRYDMTQPIICEHENAEVAEPDCPLPARTDESS